MCDEHSVCEHTPSHLSESPAMPSPYWQHVVSARRSACVLEPCFLHSPTRELVGVVVVVGGEGVVASAATAASDQSSSPIQKDACTTLFSHVPFPPGGLCGWGLRVGGRVPRACSVLASFELAYPFGIRVRFHVLSPVWGLTNLGR